MVSSLQFNTCSIKPPNTKRYVTNSSNRNSLTWFELWTFSFYILSMFVAKRFFFVFDIFCLIVFFLFFYINLFFVFSLSIWMNNTQCASLTIQLFHLVARQMQLIKPLLHITICSCSFISFVAALPFIH